ncbi:MAG: cobalamin-dependent protein [Actinobacteria bacterium]|nr:cobalamin-dependent protein [Actinomycetota bacterium]
MKVLVISDVHALGLMEVRPELAFNTEYSDYRNRSLLSPDYGIMYVTASLKAAGYDFEVVNLVADVHKKVSDFAEPEGDSGVSTGSPVSQPEAVRSSRRHLFSTIDTFSPDVVLMSVSMYSFALYFRKLAEDIKTRNPGSVLVAGGIYATFHPAEILEDGFVDIVVRGEGERTVHAVLDAVGSGKQLEEIPGISYRQEGAVVHNPDMDLIDELDVYPQLYSVADEFRLKRRIGILSELNADDDYLAGRGFLTSRGCPEACTFCLDPAVYKRKVRFHSPEYVKDAVDYCLSNFFEGPGTFFFGDAAFTASRKRLFRMLDLVSDVPLAFNIQTRADYLSETVIESLSCAGVRAVAMGAESFNNRVLQEVAGKRLKAETVIEAAGTLGKHGINTLLTFIVGFPGESRSSIERTVELLNRHKPGTATFFPLVVFRGTPLFDLFTANTNENDREAARMNPYSEEYYFTSDEFPTADELISFTREVNEAVDQGSIS